MPSASDFDAAAAILYRAADDMAGWTAGSRSHFGPDTISGGTLTLVCHQAVDVAEHLAATTAEILRADAATCARRAQAVRAYEAALGDYRSALQEWRAQVAALPSGVAPTPSPSRPDKPTFAP